MLATEHSQSIGLDILSLLSRGVDILSLRYAPAEELTVFKEVSTSLSGYSSLRIRQEVSLPVRSLFFRPDLVKIPSMRNQDFL